MTKASKTIRSRSASGERRETVQFLELVNWRAAQPNMPDTDAPWMKLYTSLLDNDAFTSLDDRARMLLIALWLYAAKSGRHIFPADAGWLRRRIPILNADPDLRPLLEAKDAYGDPRPFVRIVDKEGIYNVVNSTDRDRDRDRDRDTDTEKPLRASEKESKRKKRNASPSGDAVLSKDQNQSQNQSQSQKKSEKNEQKKTRTKRQTQTQAKNQIPGRVPDPVQTENPKNPKESEVRGAEEVTPPRPPASSTGHERDRLGRIPIWWSDPGCVAFSYAVFGALGLRCDPESVVGRSERGTFASWLFMARSRLPATDWGWLEAKAIAKAKEIARHGKGARRPGAVWLSVMHSVLCARAGPSVVTA